MNIISGGGPVKPPEILVTVRKKALIATSVSLAWGLVCLWAWFYGTSQTVRILVLASEVIFLVTCVGLWKFERPRTMRLKNDFPPMEPPIIHINNQPRCCSGRADCASVSDCAPAAARH